MLKIIIFCLVLVFSGNVNAGLIHRASVAAPVGNAQQNIISINSQALINIFQTAGYGFSSAGSQAALDQFGYPIANFTGTIGSQLGGPLSTTGPWTMAWDAGRSCFKMNFLNSANVTNIPGGVVVTNAGGTGNISVTGNCGVAGSITINWLSTSTLNMQWDGTYTQWASNTTGKMSLIRASDQTAYTNGIYWTPEVVSLMSSMGLESFRTMGWNILNFNTGTNTVNWNYRKTPSSFSFNPNADDYPPGARCGGATSWCTISVSGAALTAAAAADTPLGGWTDGEQIMGNIASSVAAVNVSAVVSNAGNCQYTVGTTTLLTPGQSIKVLGINGATECNTNPGFTTILTVDNATQFTSALVKTGTTYSGGGQIGYQTLAITGKTGGAKIITDLTGVPTAVLISTSPTGTFTYSSVLDVVLYAARGVGNGPPIEAQVQLSNLINANFWFNFPVFANNIFITSAANAVLANLNSNLKGIFEYSNENWNGSQLASQYNTQMGIALGIATNSPQPFESLRVRQIMGTLLPASSWGGSPRLERLYCHQAGFGGTGFATSPMSGASLISPGSAAYQTYVGGSAVNYNTSPNRPIDFVQSTCYAPYVGGGTAFSGQSNDVGQHAPSTNDAALLNTIVSDWNASNTAGAISLIDQSIRGDIYALTQTVTASATTFTTPLAHNFFVNEVLRFTVSGGTSYSGLNLNSLYQILSTPTGSTFTVGQVVNGITGTAVNAGSAGSGTTSVGNLGTGNGGNNYNGYTIFTAESAYYTKYQDMAVNGFSPAPAGGAPKVRWYEGALEPSPPTAQQLINSGATDTSASVLSVSGNTICFSSMPFNVSAFGSQVAFTNIGSLTGVSTGVNYTAVNVVGNCMGIQPVGSGNPATIGGTAGGAVVIGNQILATALLGWKNDPASAATIQFYYNTFMGLQAGTITTGAMPNSKAPANLVLTGGGEYALTANDNYITPGKYQLFCGFRSFSAGNNGC